MVIWICVWKHLMPVVIWCFSNSCTNNRCNKNDQLNNALVPLRERRWPPPYIDSPPLIITDHCTTTNLLQVATLTCSGADPSTVDVAIDCGHNNAVCQRNNNNVNAPRDNGNAPIDNDNADATADGVAADLGNNNNREVLSTTTTHCNSSFSPTHANSLTLRIEPATMFTSFWYCSPASYASPLAESLDRIRKFHLMSLLFR